jgi:hypothetical protein
MNDEPFGPLAPDHAVQGLRRRRAGSQPPAAAASPPTPTRRSAKTAAAVAAAVESGMVSINHHGLALAGSAVRRHEGLGLRLGGRHRRRIEAYLNTEVRHPGERVKAGPTGSAPDPAIGFAPWTPTRGHGPLDLRIGVCHRASGVSKRSAGPSLSKPRSWFQGPVALGRVQGRALVGSGAKPQCTRHRRSRPGAEAWRQREACHGLSC